MSIFSDNIRFLRGQLNLSQQKVADQLLITRARYSKYEEGASEPPLEILLKISKYHKISIDLLISIDVRKYPLDEVVNLPDNRIVLPIKVDDAGENKIEIVPQKAQMGYLAGYSDPEYIDGLQYMSLPFLRNGKYRAFPVEGDSMPPYNDGSFLLGKYVESKESLKVGKTYIFITNDGIVYKRFAKQNRNSSFVSSDNVFYKPYEIEWKDVLEIWEFSGSVNSKELQFPKSETSDIKEMFSELKRDIEFLKIKK